MRPDTKDPGCQSRESEPDVVGSGETLNEFERRVDHGCNLI